MAEDKELRIFRIISGGIGLGFWNAGYYAARSQAEAISSYKKDCYENRRFCGMVSAEEVGVEGFRVTLSPLEKTADAIKVSVSGHQ